MNAIQYCLARHYAQKMQEAVDADDIEFRQLSYLGRQQIAVLAEHVERYRAEEEA